MVYPQLRSYELRSYSTETGQKISVYAKASICPIIKPWIGLESNSFLY